MVSMILPKILVKLGSYLAKRSERVSREESVPVCDGLKWVVDGIRKGNSSP